MRKHYTITARDGKELPVSLTLDMVRDALDTWLAPDLVTPEIRGIALALEAALVALLEEK